MIRETPVRRLPTRSLDGQATERLVAVLDDDQRTSLLAALTAADEPLTVKALADRCDIPLSTVYRKIGDLTEVDVLDEHTELRGDGKHVSRYSVALDAVTIDLTADGLRATMRYVEDGAGTVGEGHGALTMRQ